MIHGIFIINNNGKARLMKVYNPVVRGCADHGSKQSGS